jgi:hypothetical protein
LVNGNRPLGLVADLLLSQWGLPDEAQSWLRYVEHLRALAADAAEQKRLGFDQFSRGWAIGTAGWKPFQKRGREVTWIQRENFAFHPTLGTGVQCPEN